MTQVRSFLGLVNQLGNFSTDIASLSTPLRELTKKDIVFNWTSEIDKAFTYVKNALTDTPTLAHFDPDCLSVLHTDAARCNGLGFVLMQQDHDGVDRVIACGSRVVSSAESRYAVGEIELQAVVWAVEKCRVYLMGRTFKQIVDHKPLVPILNEKGLQDLDGRLLRLRQRLVHYSFTTEWRKGSDHRVPDALSRAPVGQLEAEDLLLEKELTEELEVRVNYVDYTFQDGRGQPVKDLRLEAIREATRADLEMREVQRFIAEGFPTASSKAGRAAPYWSVRHSLSEHNGLIMYGHRIVVPHLMRREFLELLHQGHQGIAKTRQLVQETVFWPGISSDILSTVAACHQCEEARPSLPAEPTISTPVIPVPFAEIAAGVFDYAGRKFLVVIDRYSNWWHIYRYGISADSAATKAFLQEWVHLWGKPLRLRTDGGTNFTSQEMKDWLDKKWIEHLVSAPHYPQSNGLAESAVKAAKKLLAVTQCDNPKDPNFREALLTLRNTPLADGRQAPAVVVFGGRSIATTLPQMTRLLPPTTPTLSAPASPLPSRRELPPLPVGTHVKVQDRTTLKWDLAGVIIRSHAASRNYEVRTSRGRRIWQNRRHLLPSPAEDPEVVELKLPKPPDTPTPIKKHIRWDSLPTRRSTRIKKKPQRLITG